MAPFQPETVVADFCETLAAYDISTVVGDRYAGLWPAEQFAKRGIMYVPSERVKSDIYRDMLPIAPGTGARIDVGGTALLIEPPPMLLDHICLTAKGVWSRDIEPSGVDNSEKEKAAA